ncbi:MULTISPECIES: hypothetical protein [unclassified Roseobacter]|uniref:hypothetical protein n=1 Tax=unclassified Roseobacter TaxID=196798 RepID=UPI00149123CB|nr:MULTISPECIES: hypothetical protein [unclassified Roseobacter]NNX32667.1 hypothetical protein [Roseobacter sp. HKCCD6503]NOB92483.1 hypothetical protein [Roseobacter sp. HKCCD7397]NPU04826.1 hypothetical protein [Roseobacter sp. HKCCD6491]NPU78502.1 hypothetical protein [Roseobacter sp. HKCCD6578]
MGVNTSVKGHSNVRSKITKIRDKFSPLLATRVGPMYHRFIGSSVHRFIGSSVHRFIGSSGRYCALTQTAAITGYIILTI